MTDASWNLQTALFNLLKSANPSIAGGSVYDNLPDSVASATAPDSAFPYIQIGEVDLVPDDVDSVSGRDDGVVETITLHVWSRYAGQKEVKQIAQQIKDLLHDTQITVSGRSSALAVVSMFRAFLDPDGKTRHGVLTVEVTHRN